MYKINFKYIFKKYFKCFKTFIILKQNYENQNSVGSPTCFVPCAKAKCKARP